MIGRFTVLASGSSGNAAFLECGDRGILIDFGLTHNVIAERLASIGRSWKDVHLSILTHTHGDHWNGLTLAHFRRLEIPLVAHCAHHDQLAPHRVYDPLKRAGLIREYREYEPLAITSTLSVYAIPVPHDAENTCAFRFDLDLGDGFGWSIAYASDVGHITRTMTETFTGVDVLAIEYNHDEEMQRTSRRPQMLIRRVLGKNGHLSNTQAADFTKMILHSPGTSRVKHVVQLHLSRECNTERLAIEAGRAALKSAGSTAELTTATQFTGTKPIILHPRRLTPRRTPTFVAPKRSFQPTLPGMGAED